MSSAPTHNREENDPIDVDSDFEEHTGDETDEYSVGEDTDDEGVGSEVAHMEEKESDPEWHDTWYILRATHEEVSTKRETLVSEAPLPQDREGDYESVIWKHLSSGSGEA